MKKDIKRIKLALIVSLLVLITSVAYTGQIVKNDTVNIGSLMPLSIIILVLVFMAIFLVRRSKDIKQGMPYEDERSRMVMAKATSTSFFITMYWLIAIGMFEEQFAKMFGVETLSASQATGGGVAGMAVMFIISWIYYNKKGDLIKDEE